MSKSKTILYVWKGEYPWDVRVEKVCEALAAAGLNVYLLARGGDGRPAHEKIGSINIIRVGAGVKRAFSTPFPANPVWVKAIEKAVDSVMPDVIIPREIMLAEDCGKIALRRRIPVVMDMAEHYPAAMRDWIKYNKTAFSRFLMHKAKLPDHVEKRAVNLMSGIFVVCEEQIQRLGRQYSFPAPAMAVVHNTPPLEMFDNARRGTSAPPVVFGHHGNMTAEKSLETLIRGFDIAADSNQAITLLLAGEGESFEGYRDIISNLKNKDRITLTGKYSYSDTTALMSRIDIGVVPYQISDFNNYTIHNKIFDYWACGKPALVSETIPLKRIIAETGAGMTGNFSTPRGAAEAILEISNQPNPVEMAEKARLAAENKYNWKEDARELVRFIERFL